MGILLVAIVVLDVDLGSRTVAAACLRGVEGVVLTSAAAVPRASGPDAENALEARDMLGEGFLISGQGM